MNYNYNNSIIPFLWVRDEDQKTIEKEIDAIKNLSINSFMIESRPQCQRLNESDFCTESWFVRVGNILKYAKSLGMKVWLLDDKLFPTGRANGKILEKYPNLKAKQIKCNVLDVALCGDTSFVLTGIKKPTDRLLYFLIKGDTDEYEINVFGNERMVEIPALHGLYRIYMLIETEDSFERDGYIDMLNQRSVRVLIDEVYNLHYERFKEYFGTTFMGFFSDEPRFCNGTNWYYNKAVTMYDYSIGKLNIAYPYSDKVAELLFEKGYRKKDFLSLFITMDETTKKFRIDYMNIITQEYSKNFVEQISAWCRERNVMYAGHIIEDMGVHLTTGCGAGHYFRAMKGADYSAVDVVFHQIKPYYTNRNSTSYMEGGLVDCNFFNYTLGKLASSCAVQSASAKGKSLCEIFGAYGWGESVKDMLYLVNHMAICGINNFIPHAFSMDLQDNDCPPFFNAQGKNPSFIAYKQLFEYMDFLSGFSKKSYAGVAVLYNAESVWCGEEYYSMDLVAKSLMQNQIEFDFIDVDNLKRATCDENGIKIENCNYEYLVIPNGYLSEETSALISKLPINVITAKDEYFISSIRKDYELKYTCKNLRIKRVKQDVYMLFNEGLEKITNTLKINSDKMYLVDVFNNELISESNSGKIDFELNSGKVLFVYTELPNGVKKQVQYTCVKDVNMLKVSVRNFDQDNFVELGEKPFDFCYNHENIDFSGEVRYNLEIESDGSQSLFVKYYGEYIRINLDGIVYDGIGDCLTVKLKKGTNKIEISTCNTLANFFKDDFSCYSNIIACGLKEIKILTEKV